MTKRADIRHNPAVLQARLSVKTTVPKHNLRLEHLEPRHLLSVAVSFTGDRAAPFAAGAPPDLVHEIRGVAWNDVNGDQLHDAYESPLAGRVVYLDANQNGRLDLGETSTTTFADDPATTDIDEAGTFAFLGLAAGVYYV
ncbi:MAG: hypothetical protein WD875_11065 [Pirellulales bacterium]